jgi:DNA polymerase I-like protein with 3'-5' exonuclease and polymerase domains
MARLYPELQFLQQRRAQIIELNVAKIAIGGDGKHRAVPSSILRTATGRTQPRNFIMGYHKWVRHGMQPEEGYGMAVLDYRGQEWGTFGALSGDEMVIAGYRTGQPYMQFMIDASYAPEGVTGDTHPELETIGKIICLGSIFGLTEHKAAPKLGVSHIEARTLLKQHARTYHVGWRWRDRTYAAAVEDRLMVTKFGWKWRPVPYISDSGVVTWPSKRQICNFPCQGHGADMIRVAAILTVAAGVELVATVHDALIITAPLDRLTEAVAITKECMVAAARATIGMELFVDDKAVVEWPDYFSNKKSAAIWQRISAKLDAIEPE